MSVKLEGVKPELVEKVGRLLDAMAILGHPMRVTDGNRTVEQQQALYAQGRTKPGKIVTYADGVVKKSNHQGGRAVDCCFDDPAPYAEKHPWALFGLAAEALGLKWGGRFQKLVDRPHVELED